MGAAEVPKTIASFSDDVRNGRDAACPSELVLRSHKCQDGQHRQSDQGPDLLLPHGFTLCLGPLPWVPKHSVRMGPSGEVLNQHPAKLRCSGGNGASIHRHNSSSPTHPRHLNLGEVQPHTLRRLSNFELDRGVREQLQKVRRTGIEGART